MSVTFPVSIGIAGAPDSGKKRLIEEFVSIAQPYFEENGQELLVVASPGDAIEASYNQAMGPFGSYVEDMWAFFARYSAEQALIQNGTSYITSGTLCDNIAHCGVNMERILAGIVTPQTEMTINKYKLAMATLSLLYADRFAYTFGFYLPYKARVILDEASEFQNHFNQRVDQALHMVFGNFGLRIQVLDEGGFEEKAQVMLNTVKDVMENGPLPGSSAAMEGLSSIEAALLSDSESPTPDVVTLPE